MNKLPLFFALLLSREQQAVYQVLLPLWGYQLRVAQNNDGGFTFQVMYTDDEHPVNAPHVTRQFATADDLVAFLDDADIRCDGWSPVETIEESEDNHAE